MTEQLDTSAATTVEELWDAYCEAAKSIASDDHPSGEGYDIEGMDETAYAMFLNSCTLSAELTALRAERDNWRNDYRTLESAVVGDTGLSAMLIATQAMLFKPRCEKAEAERDALRDSRNHFKYSAKSQRDKAKRLRHRQRALMSALTALIAVAK